MPHVIIAQFLSDQECTNFLMRALNENSTRTIAGIMPLNGMHARNTLAEELMGGGLPQNGLNNPTTMAPGMFGQMGTPPPVRLQPGAVANEIAAADGSPAIFQNDEDALAEEAVRNGQGDVTPPAAAPTATGPELNRPAVTDPNGF